MRVIPSTNVTALGSVMTWLLRNFSIMVITNCMILLPIVVGGNGKIVRFLIEPRNPLSSLNQ